MAYFVNKLKGMFIPLKKREIPEEVEKNPYNDIYSIKVGGTTYWLPHPVTIDNRYDGVTCMMKIFCELLGLEKLTSEEYSKRMDKIHAEKLKESEENKDGNE